MSDAIKPKGWRNHNNQYPTLPADMSRDELIEAMRKARDEMVFSRNSQYKTLLGVKVKP